MTRPDCIIVLGLAALAGCATPQPALDGAEPDAARFYQATLEEEFGRIARQEAPGFAGMEVGPDGRLTVLVTPGADEGAAVRAARAYLGRAGTPAPLPDDVVTERVPFDADRLWQLWSRLRPLQEANAAREVVADWPGNRVVLVASGDETHAAEFAGRLREGLGLPPEALFLAQAPSTASTSRVPSPPRYPLTEIPPAVMEDTAFVCPVRPGDDDVEAPEDSIAVSLEVVTDRPSLDRPIRFRVEMRNRAGIPLVIRSTRSIGFELVVRDANKDVVGYAPAPVGGYVMGPGESGWIPLCPGERYRQEVEWDAHLLAPGRYTVELTIPLAAATPRQPARTTHDLAFVEMELPAARTR